MTETEWESESPAEPIRQRMASSGWFFWRAALLRCHLKFGRAGARPSSQKLSNWRMVNDFSGGQRPCAAEKFPCLTIALRTSHSNWAHRGVALPNFNDHRPLQLVSEILSAELVGKW